MLLWEHASRPVLRSPSCPYKVSRASTPSEHPLMEPWISRLADIRSDAKLTNWTTLPARPTAAKASNISNKIEGVDEKRR